ncbi:hypothetical protein IU433_14035 [Nocardia puris]|uniref:hypothetical protein n=1 Tax=Nocardia puris TaxID=208602 RepID=UPI0018936E5F|nr:hypothetical protein [Nocardia puris]MBF6460156.1 hypothetical protein [Nocardia puris]
MTDPLAMFWQHDVVVQRRTGIGAAGAVYDSAVTERGNVAVRNQLVRDASGDEVVASASVAFPPHVAAIPPGSRVTLPTAFGGRVTRAIGVSASNAGPPFPDTQVVYLE